MCDKKENQINALLKESGFNLDGTKFPDVIDVSKTFGFSVYIDSGSRNKLVNRKEKKMQTLYDRYDGVIFSKDKKDTLDSFLITKRLSADECRCIISYMLCYMIFKNNNSKASAFSFSYNEIFNGTDIYDCAKLLLLPEKIFIKSVAELKDSGMPERAIAMRIAKKSNTPLNVVMDRIEELRSQIC